MIESIHDATIFDDIISHLDIKWPFNIITRNSNITIEMLLELIKRRPELKNMEFLHSSRSPITVTDMRINGLKITQSFVDYGLTFEEMIYLTENRNDPKLSEIIAYKKIDPNTFMRNGRITQRDIMKNPKFGWKYELLIENKRIPFMFLIEYFQITKDAYTFRTFEILRAFKETSTEFRSQYMAACLGFIKNPNTDVWRSQRAFYDIIEYIDTDIRKSPLQLPMHLGNSTVAQHVPLDIRLANPQVGWDWNLALFVVKLPINSTADHPWLRFELKRLNGTLTIKDILDNPDVIWDRNVISKIPSIDINDIIALRMDGRPLYIFGLGDHPDLSLEIIERYPSVDWDWTCIYNAVYKQITGVDINDILE